MAETKASADDVLPFWKAVEAIPNRRNRFSSPSFKPGRIILYAGAAETATG